MAAEHGYFFRAAGARGWESLHDGDDGAVHAWREMVLPILQVLLTLTLHPAHPAWAAVGMAVADLLMFASPRLCASAFSWPHPQQLKAHCLRLSR